MGRLVTTWIGIQSFGNGTARDRADLLLTTAAVLWTAAPLVGRLATGPWATRDGFAAPIALGLAMVMAAAIYGRAERQPTAPANIGALPLTLGLLALLAADLLVSPFATGVALLVLVSGVVLLLRGWHALGRYALPLLAATLALPLPGAVLTAVTFPVRLFLSASVAVMLRQLGVPAAAVGAMLDVGPYRLFVADSCSGLQSLYSLSSIALLILFLKPPARWIGSALVLLSAVPIVVAVNILRILSVALIAWFAGIGMAEGALHGLTAVAMSVVALALMLGVRVLAERLWPATL